MLKELALTTALVVLPMTAIADEHPCGEDQAVDLAMNMNIIKHGKPGTFVRDATLSATKRGVKWLVSLSDPDTYAKFVLKKDQNGHCLVVPGTFKAEE